jgi:hypothetical protein
LLSSLALTRSDSPELFVLFEQIRDETLEAKYLFFERTPVVKFVVVVLTHRREDQVLTHFHSILLGA